MKKIFALILALVLCLSLLAACGDQPANTPEVPDTGTVETPAPDSGAPDTGAEDPAETPTGPDFTNFTTITTEGVMDFPLEFTLLPDGYNTYDTEHKGNSEVIIRYTTDAYEDGVIYEKWARVYLPYGYDPEDKDTKYNVIYFQHGNQGNPNKLFDMKHSGAQVHNLLNNLFDPEHGLMESCIIVCPTYYFVTDENDYKTPNDAAGGDGRTEGVKGNYYREVVEDLIPAVESQFNVYCSDFSEEGIKATRDHRAWAGYSRGSVCTWYMFHHNLEYFGYFMPMSAECRPEGAAPDDVEGWTDEDAYQYVKAAIDAHPDLDFFIFAASGGPNDAPAMRTQMAYFVRQTESFTFGTDTETANFYYTCSEFAHNDVFFPYYLYNARNILFH